MKLKLRLELCFRNVAVRNEAQIAVRNEAQLRLELCFRNVQISVRTEAQIVREWCFRNVRNGAQIVVLSLFLEAQIAPGIAFS